MKKISLIIIIAVLVLLAACGKNTYESSMNLANKYMLGGKYEEAILEYKKAIEIEPNNYEPYEGIVSAYISLDNDETVHGIVDIVRAYYKIAPEDERLIDYIIANIDKLPNDKARLVLEQILQFMPSEKLEEALNGLSEDIEDTTMETTEEITEAATEAITEATTEADILDSALSILGKFSADGWTYKLYDVSGDGNKDIVLFNTKTWDWTVCIYKNGAFLQMKIKSGVKKDVIDFKLYGDPDSCGIVTCEDTVFSEKTTAKSWLRWRIYDDELLMNKEDMDEAGSYVPYAYYWFENSFEGASPVCTLGGEDNIVSYDTYINYTKRVEAIDISNGSSVSDMSFIENEIPNYK